MKIRACHYLFKSVLVGTLISLSYLVPSDASTVWTNEQNNNNWNDPGNWSSHFVPSSLSDVIVRGVPQARILPDESGVANSVHVGDGSVGDLVVFGSLTSNSAMIGYGTYGIATIDGGHWTINSTTLSVGTSHSTDNGVGDLVLKNGGIISMEGNSIIFLGNYTPSAGGSQGGLQIGAMQDHAAAAPGIVNVASVHSGSSDSSALSSVQFNHTGVDYWFTRGGLSSGTGVSIDGNLQVLHTAGETSFKVANTYTGGTYLNGGILSVTDNAQLGDISSALHFNGGTIRTPIDSGDFFGDRVITWGEHGGGFDTNDAALIVKTALTGGGLRKLGQGQLTLKESADLAGVEFEGDFFLGSTVLFEKTSTLGALDLEGGRVQAQESLSVSTLTGEEAALVVANNEAWFSVGSGNYGGNLLVAQFAKEGPGTLTLSGTVHSQHVSTLHVNGGLLHLTGALEEETNSEFNNITVTGADSILDVNRVGSTLVNNLSILDGGTVLVRGTGAKLDTAYESGNSISVEVGKLTLSQGGELHSSYSDIHLGVGGSLNMGAALGEAAVASGLLTADAGRVISGTGTVVFNHTGDLTFSVPITEGVHVIKAGSGSTSLIGEHHYTGETHVSGGTLAVSGSGSSLASGAFYIGYQGEGNFVLESGTSAQVGQAYFGRFVGDSGTGMLSGHFLASTLTVGYQGIGALTVNDMLTVGGGTGTITLGFSAQGYGTLNLGSGLAFEGSIQASSIYGGAGGGLVSFNHTNAHTLNASLTGKLSVLKENSGTTTLGSINT